MEFRILGPVEVVDHGRTVSVRRGTELALLAYLLLHANEMIPSERLIDELWGERPPPTAPKILQNAVSHLRKALGDGRLQTRAPGYVFRLEAGELDLHRFERLAEQGRAASDGDKLREALALWRGEPLGDLRDEAFAQRAAHHLAEARLAVLDDRIDADLAAGLDSELVPELEDLAAAHPLRERLQGQLMTALYRAGRQADALDAYSRARRTLSAELGLEPGPQLQELERKILNQDPELAPPPPRACRPAGPPPSSSRRRMTALGLAGAALIAVAVVGIVHALGGNSKPLVAQQNSLAVVDPSRNRVVGVIPVGGTPRGVAVGTNAVWVANSADGTVSQIDPKRLKVVQTIGIRGQATDIVETGGNVWVVTGIDNGLVRIDARTGGVLETFQLSRDLSASSYAIAVGGDALWIVSGNRLLRIDPRSGQIVSRRRLLCCGHSALTDVAVGAGSVWAADLSQKIVRVSSTTGRPTGITNLGVVPTALATGYGSVWVAAPEPGPFPRVAIWRLDPLTVRTTETISIGEGGQFPPTLDLVVGDGSIWVTNYAKRTLQRIDPATSIVRATIHLGGRPYAVAVGKHRVWVTVG